METEHQKIQEIVERELSSSAHAMEHIARVYNACLHLAKFESGIDLEVLKIAALLHDVARTREFKDTTDKIDHATLGAEMADRILTSLGYSEKKIAHVKHCIAAHRYRSRVKPQTKEAKILFDADKLDVVGALGVARSFMIAGQYGQKIYSNIPIKEYLKENVVGEKHDGRIRDISKHTPNLEFELKFKHIPEKLHTDRAKKIAEERLSFMGFFFERLKMEIEGEL